MYKVSTYVVCMIRDTRIYMCTCIHNYTGGPYGLSFFVTQSKSGSSCYLKSVAGEVRMNAHQWPFPHICPHRYGIYRTCVKGGVFLNWSNHIYCFGPQTEPQIPQSLAMFVSCLLCLLNCYLHCSTSIGLHFCPECFATEYRICLFNIHYSHPSLSNRFPCTPSSPLYFLHLPPIRPPMNRPQLTTLICPPTQK